MHTKFQHQTDYSSPNADPLGLRKPVQARVKDGYLPKKRLFYCYWLAAWKQLQIGTDMLLIITSSSDKLFSGVNIDGLEWPWTCKLGDFSVFFLQFLSAVQISRVNCDKMDEDRPRQWANRNCKGCCTFHELCSNYLFRVHVNALIYASLYCQCSAWIALTRWLEWWPMNWWLYSRTATEVMERQQNHF